MVGFLEVTSLNHSNLVIYLMFVILILVSLRAVLSSLVSIVDPLPNSLSFWGQLVNNSLGQPANKYLRVEQQPW